MSRINLQPSRKFLQSLSMGAAAIGAFGLTKPMNAMAGSIASNGNEEPEE